MPLSPGGTPSGEFASVSDRLRELRCPSVKSKMPEISPSSVLPRMMVFPGDFNVRVFPSASTVTLPVPNEPSSRFCSASLTDSMVPYIPSEKVRVFSTPPSVIFIDLPASSPVLSVSTVIARGFVTGSELTSLEAEARETMSLIITVFDDRLPPAATERYWEPVFFVENFENRLWSISALWEKYLL